MRYLLGKHKGQEFRRQYMNYEFKGVQLLNQYFQQRRGLLSALLKDLGAMPAYSQIHANVVSKTDFQTADTESEETIKKIEKIFQAQLSPLSEYDLESKRLSDFLTRKFEANGRLSPAFDQLSERGSKGEIDLQTYALFAVTVCFELDSQFNYSKLSTLLKLNDLLSFRYSDNSTSALAKQCLCHSVATELELLGQVMGSKVIRHDRD